MQNRDEMHPSDRRNLIIFAVLSIAMWLTYDYFIARPHAEAMRQQAMKAKAVAESTIPSAAPAVLPVAEVVASGARIKIETPAVEGSINLTGARLDDLRLKDYYKTVEKTENVHVLSPAKTPFPRYVESGWTGTGVQGLPDSRTEWTLKSGSASTLTPTTPVTLVHAAPSGVTFEKTFSVDENFGFKIEDKIVNAGTAPVTLYPFALATEHGTPDDFLNLGVIHEGPIGYIGESLEEFTYKDFKKKPEQNFTGQNGWIGLTGKYWLTAIAPEQGKDTRYRFISTKAAGQGPAAKDRYQTDITGPAVTVAPGATQSYAINVFSGAKKLKLLEQYEDQWKIPHFDLAVDFGWFYFLTKPFFLAINFLYGLTGNFGIAIILFTCVLRIFVFPLANTSYRSFAKMRQVAPEMYTIRHEYKDNKQKLQEELVKLYQRHNVNPAAGCLPILVQIPIFFALYKVLSNTIEMRHAPFYGWIKDLSAMDPTTIFNLFGLIPWTPPHMLMIGAWPLLMMAGMIIQKNISPPPEDPIQARIIGLMPYFMTFIMAKFAAGLVIYWTVNNLLAILQQIVIMKSMGVPIHLFKTKTEKKLEQEIKDGPVVHPELQLLEQKVEHAFDGGDGKVVSAPKPKKKKKK